MPCNGGHYFDTQYVSDPEQQKQIDVLTRRLCHACQLMEDNNVSIPAELDEWWYEHKLQDEKLRLEAKRRAEQEEKAQRRERYLESVRERVIGQLTDDEREALGLE